MSECLCTVAPKAKATAPSWQLTLKNILNLTKHAPVAVNVMLTGHWV
jgi:hypothetical protein